MYSMNRSDYAVYGHPYLSMYSERYPDPVFVSPAQPNPAAGFPFPVIIPGNPTPFIHVSTGPGTSFPPGFPFQGGGQGVQGPPASSQAPQGPPPAFIPAKPQKQGGGGATALVDTNVLQFCLFRYTYVWLNNGNHFWFFPIAIGKNAVGGFTWNSVQNRPFFIALDSRNIDNVSCSY